MKRLLFYCQHVLGMGHLVRSLAIVRGLPECKVCFVNGGEAVNEIQLPDNTKAVSLPVLMSDTAFQDIYTNSGVFIEGVKAERKRLLLQALDEFQPHAVVIELFPFGRRKFAFELMPLLEAIRERGSQTRVICSLRDIVVSKKDRERFEAKVRAVMDEYFDLLLIHSDPEFQRLDESFHSCDKLRCPIEYTGFVTRDLVSKGCEERMVAAQIVASIGGGRVGCELLEAVIAGSEELSQSVNHRLRIFTGPFLPNDDFSRLKLIAGTNPAITVERFTPSLPEVLQSADLSISMAGYNTCMDVITTGVPALFYPFTGGENEEQSTRARKLEARGYGTVLGAKDLEPKRMAERMKTGLAGQRHSASGAIDTRGVERTAALLRKLMVTQ